MKKLLLIPFLVSGCISPVSIEVALKMARNAPPDKKACFYVEEPKELAGLYCLKYEGAK